MKKSKFNIMFLTPLIIFIISLIWHSGKIYCKINNLESDLKLIETRIYELDKNYFKDTKYDDLKKN